ncbi:NADH dehydrogenase (ubiquinone) 30 kDa subunit [Desulfobulbus propionicus DSM 2032]|uniref:NADH dehydrogenase (Ubiquinone) 30 kDa subunit n=1 Tax=Desulfobulbus propionicus (strain ATCC 33891 / DSM 2032 / VKM B-1956 / 1pr3) TaxID=577650 RepID=A0A7U3YKI4_DESPD|nr:NADH-quinone oxidoreductase subunit C [Desulfobulbus propionicus]ADW17040.1 NADH dehydrogenase (ubiquinone) 30 kDa subunit [Desulfobulbus propionicus DSM 2032]
MDLLEKTEKALRALFPETAPVAVSAEEGDVATATRTEPILTTDPARHGHHLDVLCKPDQVVAVARVMDSEGYFLESISGVDWIDRQQLEILYDYNRLGGAHCRVMVRTLVPRSGPVVPTISAIFPSADWHERETYDFYGVHFQDHPNLIRILLPEDADFHPLLKDFMP